MKSEMPIAKKLIVAFGAMLVLTLGLAYSSLTSINSLSETLSVSTTVTAKKADLIGQIGIEIANMSRAQRGLVLYSMMKDPAHAEEVGRPFLTTADKIEKNLAEIRPLLSVERSKQAVERIAVDLAAWRPLYSDLHRLCEQQRFDNDLKETINKMVAYGVDASSAVDVVAQIQRDRYIAARQKAAEDSSRSRWIALVLIVLSLSVGGVVVFTVRGINNALRNLTAEMTRSAEQVASASSQVATSSQAQAHGASEQAASLEQTSASAEQIHAMTQRNASSSKAAADLMVDTSAQVEQANRVVDQMVASMKEINTASDQVAKIIKVIDDIAFQTNILSLNAAVEAARAGEAGMGFAVVADEVRNLAQRCAQAARETAELIEQSIAKTNDGKNKLDQVTAVITSITRSANSVRALVDEVNLGSQEQVQGIEQIAKAVTEMQRVTQDTAASAEESASASEELSAQAQTMHAGVEELQNMVGKA